MKSRSTTHVFLLFYIISITIAFTKGLCHDLLGNCGQMPRQLCDMEQSRDHMKKLCAKTCGYCYTPPRTDNVFMMYLANEASVLKKEVFDIKAKLRDIAIQQEEKAKAISQIPGYEGTNQSQSQPEPTSAQKPQMVNKMLVNNVLELKNFTQILANRAEEQISRYNTFENKYINNLSDTSNIFTGQVQLMRKEVVSLAKDLRTYVEQIQLLPDVKQELDALEESTTAQNQEHENVTSRSIRELRDFTNNFLQAQKTFYDDLEKERLRSSFLEKTMTYLNDAFEKEKKKKEDLFKLFQMSLDKKEKKQQEDQGNSINEKQTRLTESDDSAPPDVLSTLFDGLSERMERVVVGVDAQTKRIDVLTTFVATLSKDLANATAEQRSVRKYLDHQYAMISRRMKALFIKLDNLENFSEAVINKTVARVSSPAANHEQFSQLSSMVLDIFNQLKSLKMKRPKAKENNPGTAIPTPSGLTQRQLEMMRDMAQDVNILKDKVAYGAEWMGTLDVKIAAVANRTSHALADIKTRMQEMAKLRNNETLYLQDFKTEFQRGIAGLIGRQRSNAIRFFNPRFDWEKSRFSIYGYVAMSHQGEWGTICDDNFDDKDAQVLCMAAGYKGGVYNNGKYKVSDGTINGKTRNLHSIWVDELHCDGTEQVVEDCQSGSEGWGIHDCDHDEDVGIKCFIS